MRRLFGDTTVELLRGDITRVPADAIVNAANSALRGGGGVDGAIHRAGGPSIMEELDRIRTQSGECPAGSAVATGAGNLPARFVFHAVGPVYRDGKHGEATLLASCYATCLRMAAERGVRRITFPSISTGAYGYPVHAAAHVALEAVSEFLRGGAGGIREIVFVLFDQQTFDAYRSALEALSPDAE